MKTRNSQRAGVVGIALMILLLWFPGGAAGENLWAEPEDKSPKAAVPIQSDTISRLAEKMRPGVVNINTTAVVQESPQGRGFRSPFGPQDPFREFWERFFGGETPQEFRRRSLGSGVLINKDGYILTNNHVIQNAKEIRVTLFDEKTYQAKVIGRDPKTDLALIRIEAGKDLPAALLGDSDRLKVGDWVVAIGNPFGLAETVTAGIVSAKGRAIGAGPYDDFIQTDASINPGNSGGPLFNIRGEVVGINTAIVATGQGIGFAIPINLAKEIIPQLKEKGHVTRAWLGVSIQKVSPDLAESFGLRETKGALVAQVFKGTPAEKAGIQAGDIILEFAGKKIDESRELPRIVAATPVGKKVGVQIFRGGKTLSLEVVVAEMEEDKREAAREMPTPGAAGIQVQNVTPDIARSLGMEKAAGVVVVRVEPGSPAEEARIRRGDVILEVNRRAVDDLESFFQAVEKAGDRQSLLFLIRRSEGNFYVTVTPR
jgi:serine protease Do